MKSAGKSKNTTPPKVSRANIKKIIKKYRLEDAEKQEEEDLKYWSSASISEKTEMTYSLWEECYWIQEGVNILLCSGKACLATTNHTHYRRIFSKN